MVNYLPEKLVEFVRDGLVEQEHSGFFVKVSDSSDVTLSSTQGRLIERIGDDKNYPFYLRSCAKPLQASLIVDYGLVDFYNMTSEEIAFCCASHAGESCHVEVGRNFLKKIGLDNRHLKCGLHKPISKSEQEKLVLAHEKENVFQNNCSGKHIMMLAICKKMGWGVSDYDSPEHPLQVAIQNKIYELCEVDENYSITKDGCGVPIMAMPLENMVKGFLNLFLDEKYACIKEAFIKNPYLIGGEDRLDTAIMSANPDLIAKVGAGGLCIVINLIKKEGLIVKILDCDMRTRAVSLLEALRQLGWLTDEMLEHPLVKAQDKKDILTLHGEKIGEAKFLFRFK